MSLTSHEKSPEIELEEMDGNEPKSTVGSGMTVVSSSAVADQSEGQAQDLNERNGEESAENRGLPGGTGGSQSLGNNKGAKTEEDMGFGEVNLSALYRGKNVTQENPVGGSEEPCNNSDGKCSPDSPRHGHRHLRCQGVPG